ncbi:MAG: hypothetical protein JF609_00850 [Verrucomicrobia bacterium]|nr:hypothetical protein [Verrucomicrobiota bacterium]
MTTGISSTLWDFDGATPGFHIIGYALAFAGANSLLSATNQNKTLQAEPVTTPTGTVTVPVADRVLIADAILSDNANQVGAPPNQSPAGASLNNYAMVPGGFQVNGVVYPHSSPHLKGDMITGGTVGFKDGHAIWQKYNSMIPRTASGKVFWW